MGTVTSGTTGSTSADGICGEEAISTVAAPVGTVWPNDQIGWAPLGAAMVTLIRDPAR